MNTNTITENENHWSDSNGNKCYFSYFGSKKAALKAIESLTNCSDCFNSSDCSDCSDYSDCFDRSDCSDKQRRFIPIIEDLNRKVLKAVTQEGSRLEMNDWHTCKTTHCWAGWIVHIAGKEGYQLEDFTSTLFAAMQIYKKSNGESINPSYFYLSNEDALEKIEALAS